METLEIKKENALKAYDGANEKGKKMLENLFGRKTFLKKVTDRIKTFEDALAEVGASDEVRVLLAYTGSDPVFLAAVNFTKATIICQALNEGWVPNWDNSSEYKYYPWFKMAVSSGFRYDGCVGDFTYSAVGSRLVFKSSELAVYAGTQFTEIYKSFMTL